MKIDKGRLRGRQLANNNMPQWSDRYSHKFYSIILLSLWIFSYSVITNLLPTNVLSRLDFNMSVLLASRRLPLRTFSRCYACKPYTIPKPRITNAYDEDPMLKDCLTRFFPPTELPAIEKDLTNFGKRVVTDMQDLAAQCEREKPQLSLFDCWGNQSNQLVVSNAWKEMKRIAAQEGLIAIPYERKYGEFSRLYHFAKLWMYMPSSGLYGCPLAMTDGAAHLLLHITGKTKSGGNMANALRRLTSRNPNEFFTSGQWMTEIKGGCDVANATETVAVPQNDGSYRLYGFKFFTSAVDADLSITLARVASNQKGEGLLPGNRGLALFMLNTKDEHGEYNGLRMLRLKDKLGTRQLPTAELILDGSKAEKISDVGRGISEMANMLMVTRFWTSLSSASTVRRMALLARDYATRRETFGSTLDKHTLHIYALGTLEMEARAGFLLILRMSQLLGLQENGKISPSDMHLLRLLMPLAKGVVCKRAMPALSEGLELFGGQGYMEDSGIPVLFRDAQVQPIWEGTTNIQAIDLIRAIAKSEGAVLKALLADTQRLTSKAKNGHIVSEIQRLTELAMSPESKGHLASSEANARDFMMALGGFYCAALLFDHAVYTGRSFDFELAERWLELGRADWSGISRRLKEGFYSSAKLENIKNAVFLNHTKVDESKSDDCCNKTNCCSH